jgi:hypothetical protein
MNNRSYKKYGWPLKPSRVFLNRIYKGYVPPADNFLIVDINRYGIYRLINPFRIDPRDCERKFGRNLNMPLDHCFEMQLNDFVEKALKNHDDPNIEITKGILKRMGRAGCLYRHGFEPKSSTQVLGEIIKKIERLELEIEQDKRILEKRKQFEKKRKIKRQEARKIFDSLHQKDQYRLQEEYEYARTDPRILIRGGKFEDFLIREFKLATSLFEEISKTHKMRMRLREISICLKDIIQKRNKNEIESTEFVRVYKSCAKELNELDSELKGLLTTQN